MGEGDCGCNKCDLKQAKIGEIVNDKVKELKCKQPKHNYCKGLKNSFKQFRK